MNRFQVRRATLDDLPQLRQLWEMMDFPSDALEKRLPEFQVVDDGAGQLLAAVGVQILAGHGRIHSESIALPDQEEDMRTLLWPRLDTLARNQGLARLWTSLEAPFWKGVGFKKVSPETLAQLPAGFAEENATWLTMPLRADGNNPEEVERLFAQLKVQSQADQDRLTERAKMMKAIALTVMVLVFAAFAIWVVMFAWLKKGR